MKVISTEPEEPLKRDVKAMILKNLFTLWHLGPHIASSSGLKASCHEWPGLSVRSLTSRLEGSSDSVDFKPKAKRLDNESSGLDAKDGFLPYCFFLILYFLTVVTDDNQ